MMLNFKIMKERLNSKLNQKQMMKVHRLLRNAFEFELIRRSGEVYYGKMSFIKFGGIF